MDTGSCRERRNPMLDTYFQCKVKELFYEFTDQYELNITSKAHKVIFQSKSIHFTVYFERNFEIYIVFIFKCHHHNKAVDLNSILQYLKMTTVDTNISRKNQVSSQKDIDYVLSELKDVMRSVLYRICNDKNFLYAVYVYQQQLQENGKKQHLLDQMSFELNKAWESKNYAAFLETYEKFMQKDKTVYDDLSEIQKKRLGYAQKQIN